MSTLIAVYNSEKCIGRCDAKCHNAVQPDCDCICAVGPQKAAENTREMAELWLERYAEEKGLEPGSFKVVKGDYMQLGLFETEGVL